MRRCIPLIALLGLASQALSPGLPDRVGFFVSNVFLAENGVNLEDHVLDADTWSENRLVGKWARNADADQTPLEAYRLESSAAVFGVPASEVRVFKDDGALDSFVIRYQPGKEGVPENLLMTLRTNIETYTGQQPGKGGAESRDCRFSYKDFAIALAEPDSETILLSIRRRPAQAVSQK